MPHALAQKLESIGGKGETDGVRVAAEAGEEIGRMLIVEGMGGRERIKQVKAGDGSTGAVGLALLVGEDESGAAGAFDDAGGEDAEHAAMPVGMVEDEALGRVGSSVIEQGEEMLLDGVEGFALGGATSLVKVVELGGEFRCARSGERVRKSSMTSSAISMRPAALMRGPSRKPTSEADGERSSGREATCMRARRPGWTGLASSRRPRAAMVRFSPRRGTESAMVAMATSFRKEGRRRVLRNEREATGFGCVAA